ncbi:MAG: class I SAM-dependent methyltransferase [Acidobacteriia bacterium]|nr:class I SAM-dependent methyltransferase [Terriglobia bacterium]
METIRRFPPSGAVFDIGGGNGYVALAIQESGFDVVVVEPGPDGARNARRRGIRSVICATVENAGFLDRSMAAAGLFDVLEHIEDDLGFLKSLARRLLAGGRLYLTVPAFSALWSQEDNDAGHYRRYTLRQLRNVLERAGLEAEYLTYFFACLPAPILLSRGAPVSARHPAPARGGSRPSRAGGDDRELAGRLAPPGIGAYPHRPQGCSRRQLPGRGKSALTARPVPATSKPLSACPRDRGGASDASSETAAGAPAGTPR